MEFIHCAFIGGIGFPELIVIFIIILLLFGAKKLPEIAKSLGIGIKEFKNSLKDESGHTEKEDKDKDTKLKG